MSTLALALPFDFQQPKWLWLVLLIPLLVVGSLRSLAGLEPARRIAALTIRSLLILLIALALAGVERVQRTEDLTVMFIMDRSASAQSLEKFAEDYVREAADEIPPADRLGLIDFARHAYLQQQPMRGGYFIQPGRLPQMPSLDRTDIAGAIRLAMATFPHDSSKRVVLFSDGNDNMGDVLAEARRARADGIPIDVVPLRTERRNEVFVDRVLAPTHAEPGEQVSLRIILHSDRRAVGRLAVYQNGERVRMSEDQTRVELAPGSNTFMVKLGVDSPGAQTYEVVFEPESEAMDAVALNNRASAFTFVAGSTPALLISTDPNQDRALLDALRSERVTVDMKTTEELGEFSLLQMMNYSSLLLANVPAGTFTDQQQQDLATYVKDMGGGLIMLGGPESFGAGGWIGTPVEEVMPVSFEIKHKKVLPRGALVVIMHSCEIPRGNAWGKEMAKKSVDTISSQDYLGVIAYTYSPGGENWEVPLALNTNKAAVKAKIDRMQIGDMPDFDATMRLAYAELANGKGKDAAQKHVIILSDGDPQAPAPKLLDEYVAAKITVSTIGIGWGAHVMVPTMKSIAEKTGGRFYDARNPKLLPQIFVKESQVVRRPLIVDEPFTPGVLHASSELLSGFDLRREGVPALGGFVMTQVKPSPNVFMPLIRASDDGDDPVLAHWQYELGKTVAFTSGYWRTWGQHWTSWNKYAKFWAQVVRWTLRQETPANFDTSTRIDGTRGRIVVDALDKDAEYLNNLQLRTQIAGPEGASTSVRFTQTGPGHYEAEFEVEKAGPYLANVQIFDGARAVGTIRTGVSAPFSPEYRDLKPNEALLRQVAEISGGRFLEVSARDAKVFNHDLPPSVARRSAWEWVVAWLLLPAFLLDVAVRRLASWLALSVAAEALVLVVLLFGVGLRYSPWWGVLGAFVLAELVGWTIRFRSIGPFFDWMTHTVTALAQAGDRSAVALEKLKGTRDRVRDELAGGDVPPKVDEERPAIPADRGKRRFDVGDEAAKRPAVDLTESLGGAKTDSPADREGKPTPPPASESDDLTSRLLRAKKRARKDTDDHT